MDSIVRSLRWLFVLPVRLYQGTISRITPATCRFKPTCSQYAVEAVERHGVLRGGALSTWRLLRCNPFVEGGWDPVPDTPTTEARSCKATPNDQTPGEK
jgi:uncharacterized protein